jgi:hypothetical protein
VNEKEANHPGHPMDRTANWCSHGSWFTLTVEDMRKVQETEGRKMGKGASV